MKKVKGKDPVWPKIGLKLLFFRRKLSLALKIKITQQKFGKIFGDYTARQIQAYEKGAVEIPAKLFYLIARAGFSIDAIFKEHEVTVPSSFNTKTIER